MAINAANINIINLKGCFWVVLLFIESVILFKHNVHNQRFSCFVIHHDRNDVCILNRLQLPLCRDLDKIFDVLMVILIHRLRFSKLNNSSAPLTF